MAPDPPAVTPAPVLDRPFVPGLPPRVAAWALRVAGWTVRLAQPVPERCVAIFYPHTSNWDTVIGLCAKTMIGVRFHFVGKDTLFRFPLAPLLTRMGGIPVNRREPAGFVRQMKAEFDSRREFRLALAPEGTRRRTEHWKSGFYRLATAASVPVGLAYIDYPRREIGVGAWLDLTGDVAIDMARFRAFYAGKVGLNPENQGPIHLHDEPPESA
jgi:1-acyl-sn-glycerol-3-phosphate acyltransferase